MLEYVPILQRAVDGLDPNTEEARRVLYDRARRALADRFQEDGTVLKAESAALENAIERVEAGALDRAAQAEQHPAYAYEQPAENAQDEVARHEIARDWRTLLDGRKLRRSIVGAAAALAILLASVIAYALWPKNVPVARNVTGKPAESVAEASVTNLGYFYLRQPVYYRTSQPVGTIIVDKSQNFLYVVGQNVSALRYGIGVGPECTATAGLYRIVRKEELPGQSAAGADAQKKSPFGARALYLNQNYRIHGSDGPAWIGKPVPDGCIRLMNNDVVDLYDRAPLETRVVVQN